MKKLAIIISLAVASPVFACPHEDAAEAPKTAEKTKDTKGTDTKAKDAPKTDATTAKKKDEPKTDTAKKADKVTQK